MTKDMYNLLKQIDEEVEPKTNKAKAADPKKIAKKLFNRSLGRILAIVDDDQLEDELEGVMIKNNPESPESKALRKQVANIIKDYRKQIVAFARGL